MPEQRNPARNVPSRSAVFLNIPYDERFQKLYLAYIAGLTAIGLVPRAVLEIPTSQRRLDRILALVQQCQFSIHDLSRVETDRAKPRTPRFNMPFELGMVVAWQRIGDRRHRWYVCESMRHRLTKSLSDLNGTDPLIHDGRVRGVCAALCNIFRRTHRAPTVPAIYRIYLALVRALPMIVRQAGTRDLYSSQVFYDLQLFARTAREQLGSRAR